MSPTCSTFFANSQLITSVHWFCYCTFHVYVVIHLVSVIPLSVCYYRFCRWRYNYLEGIALTVTYLWLSQYVVVLSLILGEKWLFVLLILVYLLYTFSFPWLIDYYYCCIFQFNSIIEYNITNSTWHFGPNGSLWTGLSLTK